MISIAMSYYRRLPLLRRTLISIARQESKPAFEVLICNDDQHDPALADLCRRFNHDPAFGGQIRLFNTGRTQPYRGPAYPWNCAARQAKGDMLVIQNPECMHIGPVLRHFEETLSTDPSAYLSMRCVPLAELDYLAVEEWACVPASPTTGLKYLDWPGRAEYIGDTNPRLLYFCAALRREEFERIGGIEEEFTTLAYEDDYFVFTVQQSGLRARRTGSRDRFVFHQWHATNLTQEYGQALMTSKALYERATAEVRANRRPWQANSGQPWGQLPQNAEVDLCLRP